MKVIIKWLTRDQEAISSIRKYFNWPDYTTVNGWSPGTINSKDREMLEECARRGFFTYFEKDWTFNGLSYGW